MLIWNLFFLAKILLWWQNKMDFLPVWNLGLFGLAIFAALIVKRNRWLGTVLHVFLVLPLAVALTLKEAGLVLTTALLQQIQNLLGFSQTYLLELFNRTFPPEMIWTAITMLALMQILNRYIRLGTWVAMLLVGVAITAQIQSLEANKEDQSVAEKTYLTQETAKATKFEAERVALSQEQFNRFKEIIEERERSSSELTEETPSGHLNAFFKNEEDRTHPGFSSLTTPDFDVIFLHICSIAWADLQQSMQRRHPLLEQADLVFSDFNTAASYSGPATIRFMRSNCGQSPHNSLYTPIDNECSLFNSLSSVGFQIQLGMNHDGIFDNFKNQIVENLATQAVEPVSFNEVSLGGIAFDGSEIGRDSEFLKKWWDRRLNLTESPVALYYNTITLHDGNTLPNSNLNSLDSYPIRLERLLNDIKNFIDYLKVSKRKAMVFVVPEHGAGMSGEHGQLKGLRELPTPAITKGPVLAYWVSPDYVRRDIYKFPIEVNKPTSYMAVTEFLSRWIGLPPQRRDDPKWPILTSNLPGTSFVAEQDQIVVMDYRDEYLIKSFGDKWQELEQ